MAAQANIVVNDGEATPVSRTFAPRGVNNGVALWQDVTYNPVIAGFGEIRQELKRPVDPASEVYKVIWTMALPILETVSTTGTSSGYSAAPKVAYVLRGKAEFWLPTRCTTQDRKNLEMCFKNLQGQTVHDNVIQNLDPAY